MARRRGSRTRTIVRYARRGASRGRRSLGGMGGVKGWFKSGAQGIGGSQIGSYVGGMVGGPTGSQIGGLAGAYFAGGVKGLVVGELFKALTGQGGILAGLGGIFGGGTRSSSGDSL